jgi:membrane protein required for colicin V production
MTLHPLNALDALILIILGWNIVRGFNKGFVEEVISVVGVVVSIVIAFKFSHVVAGIFSKDLTIQTVVLSGFFLYAVSFLIFKYLAFSIDRKLSKTVLGILNNVLGFLFGIVRGIVIASLFVVAVSFVAPESYLIKKSYLGGICVPVIDFAVERLPERTKEKLLPRWELARAILLRNWKSWDKNVKEFERKERAV